MKFEFCYHLAKLTWSCFSSRYRNLVLFVNYTVLIIVSACLSHVRLYRDVHVSAHTNWVRWFSQIRRNFQTYVHIDKIRVGTSKHLLSAKKEKKSYISAKIQRNISIFSISRHFWSRQRCAIHSYVFYSGSWVMKFSPLKFKLYWFHLKSGLILKFLFPWPNSLVQRPPWLYASSVKKL